MLGFLQWMADTKWSIALHESLYVWPFVESAHVLTITIFVGTVCLLDLRLLGLIMKGVPASDFTGRVLPWTRFGFWIMLTTGLLLFYATPVRYYQNIFFRIKVILLVVAGLNVYLFHSRIHRRVSEWDVTPIAPKAARLAAIVSLVAWAGIVIAGRLVAYNWFDCDIQPQPAWVNWAASCVVARR
jgi:hypothetical protein